MFAVGHLALGYLTGKAVSKLLKTDVNLPVLFLFSMLPDVDLLIPGLGHRGITHSVIIFFMLFFLAFVFYGKEATPYFIALVQHPILGDYLTGGGGIQLLWPLSAQWYGPTVQIASLTNIVFEWVLFLTFLTVMLKTKDMSILFQHHLSNLLLFAPVSAVIFPMLFSFPLAVPAELVVPHMVYLVLFAISILVDFHYVAKRMLH